MLVKYLISTYIYLNVFSKCVASQKKKTEKKIVKITTVYLE